MMTWKQHLLGKLAEECAEAAQRALKQQQFGAQEIQPGQPLTNSNRLANELIDLEAIVRMLQDDGELPVMNRAFMEDAITEKAAKVIKFAGLSRELGQLEKEDLNPLGLPDVKAPPPGKPAPNSLTTDRNDPGLRVTRPDGQQEKYLVLSDAERAKGFVRPLRTQYRHLACSGITNMGLALSETYAREPSFYGATFCVICGRHFSLVIDTDAGAKRAFVWQTDNTGVGE